MLNDKKNLISPITGGQMCLKWDLEEVEYRKEKLKVWYPYYECADTGNRFTTTESDGVWCRQMHQQYCLKYGIPFTDEIIALRERYGLSAQKMALILGFGENQWRKYEQEEVPSVSNGRVIRSAMNPKVMLDFVESARGVLTVKEYEAAKAKVQAVIDRREDWRIEEYETKRVFAYGRGVENGFGQVSLSRLKNVMLYVLEHCGEVWTTKMNKLLFYIDFLSYRERGIAITGLSYRAIDFGPVPERWERVYSQFDEIRQEVRAVGEYEGNVLTASAKADETLFAEEELQIIVHVCEKLGMCSSRQVSELSHQEKAWLDCHDEHRMIPFEDAFALKGM